MRGVILVDYNTKNHKGKFYNEMNKYGSYEILGCPTNGNFFHTKVGTLTRYLIYFVFPLYFLLFRSLRFEEVIAWQQFYGINYAFWSRLLHAKKRTKLAICTFIFKDKAGAVGKLYKAYMKYAINNKYVDCIICYSSTEPSYYAKTLGVPREKFQYFPLAIDKIEGIEGNKGNYVFSSGRSNRDYEFMIGALKDTDKDVKIACSGYNNSLGGANIEILQNCFGREMLKTMANSFCVAVPLKDTHISSGQLVFLQAKQLGKPVIATENDTVNDYIQDGVDGFIIKKDPLQLRDVIQRLSDNPDLYDRISRNAKASFDQNNTMGKLADNIYKLFH